VTERDFALALRRGLGSAIIELQNNPSNAAYRDTVLRCCLRDISYDWQVEGTKGCYLYYAICALDENDSFEHAIIEKFMNRCTDRLFLQLTAILSCYADDKSALAKDALHAKYEYFAAKNGRLLKKPPVDEGFQWEQLTCRLFDIVGFGFPIFKRYATDIGELLCKYPAKSNLYYYDNFMSHAKAVFSEKRITDFIDKKCVKSNAIKAIVDTLKSEETSREQYQANKMQKSITIETLLEAARSAALEKASHYGAVMRLRYQFMKNASETDILDLANAVIEEKDETAKGFLLRFFLHKPFPLGMASLIEYAQSENEILAENAIGCLEEFKNKKIHDIAVQLLNSKGLKSCALGLLIKNYQKSDVEIIYRLIKNHSTIPHHVQMDLREIFNHHRSHNAFPILFFAYKKGDCSFCRNGIVEAMNHCGVLTDEIINECLYDSYDDTRRLAKKYISRRCAKRKEPV